MITRRLIAHRRFYLLASIPATSLSLSLLLSSVGCSGASSNSSNASPSSSSGKTLTSISVTPPAANTTLGSNQQFKATATYSDNSTTDVTSTATWTSAATTVATINSSGVATPVSAGSTTIAAALSGAQGTATLTVAGKAVSSIAVSPATTNMAPGGTQQFSAKATYSDGTTADVSSTVSWAAGTPSVATITASGLATGMAQGSTTISATLGGITGTATLNDVAIGAAVVISPTAPVIGSTQTQQFTATLQGFTSFNWFVDNIAGGSTTVGTISPAGLYTPPSKVGSHTITATSTTDSSLTASTSVSIFTFTLSYPSATVAPSATDQFTANITGISNTAVTWSVDGVANGSSTVGSISATGLYTAPGTLGPHTITATSSADPTATASAAITVNNQSATAVLTYHNDDARDGAFLEETVLNPNNVNSTQFGKLASYTVDGQIYAQPLYVPNVSIPGVGLRNVVFVETQNNTVYAFDADATSSQTVHTFWSKHLGTSVPKNDVSGVNPNVGILSTPVIDATTNIMYLFAEIRGAPFTFHALDITTGNEVLGGPVPVTGSVNGTGLDSQNSIINLEDDCYQRMGLALSPITNWVYIAFGSCNHGWVFAYDKKTLQRQAIFNDTPDGGGGGLWASGGAPAIDDSTGDLYLMSGVDPGDPVTNGYNDSILRLDPNNLTVLDFFTPSNNLFLEQNDTDLGSGSNVLMPDSAGALYPHVTIGGGKDGNIFVVDRTNMGGYLPNGSNNVIQTLSLGGGIDNIFSTPAYWNGTLYYHSNGNVLRSYYWNPNNNPPLTAAASANVTYNMHGATVSVSAQGTTNGIVWDIDNSAYNGNTPSSSGSSVLHAYNATNLNELYNSAQAGSRDTAGTALKFTVPTITGGKVYVPTSTELDIYGLLP
jgi:hypothetical protein